MYTHTQSLDHKSCEAVEANYRTGTPIQVGTQQCGYEQPYWYMFAMVSLSVT